MMEKNNVIRLLESRHISFESFVLSDEKRGAIATAALLQVDPILVYKTIVVCREKKGKNILAVVPGSVEVDLKKLAHFINEKKLFLPSEKEAEALTGLSAGGISPLALQNKGFQVIMDESSLQHEMIHISGGQRNLNIKLPVKDLITLVSARIADITIKNDLSFNNN